MNIYNKYSVACINSNLRYVKTPNEQFYALKIRKNYRAEYQIYKVDDKNRGKLKYVKSIYVSDGDNVKVIE